MKKTWKKWCEEGLRWPYLHDPVSKKPSVSLMFPYITFIMAMVSVICLHFWPSMVLATWTSIGFWIIATVFYMIRKINKAKFSLEEKSFEIANSEAPEEDSPEEINEDNIGN